MGTAVERPARIDMTAQHGGPRAGRTPGTLRHAGKRVIRPRTPDISRETCSLQAGCRALPTPPSVGTAARSAAAAGPVGWPCLQSSWLAVLPAAAESAGDGGWSRQGTGHALLSAAGSRQVALLLRGCPQLQEPPLHLTSLCLPGTGPTVTSAVWLRGRAQVLAMLMFSGR